jgi:hypothetical protein
MHRRAVDAAEGEFATEVSVTLRSGASLQTAVAMPRGSLAAPFSTAEYWAKFDDCAGPVMLERDKQAARLALNELPFLPKLAALMAPLGRAFTERRQLQPADGER